MKPLAELPKKTIEAAVADVQHAAGAAIEAAGQRAFMDGIAREIRSTRALVHASICIQLAFFAPPWISLIFGALAGERLLASIRYARPPR